ncbi:hypothetical protein [Thomasclavelia cocleata]|nr:hypothetical protein [Thomasclavelia cocleata]
MSLLYALGYMSATSNVSSFVRIVIGTIALCIADIKSYLQWKVINWNK